MRSRGSLETLFIVLLAASRPFVSSANSDTNTLPYAPIKKVDIAAYIGLWYQTYASASVIWTFELGGNCVTAEYFATDKDRTVRVENTVRPFASYLAGEDFFGSGILRSASDLVVNGYLTQSPDVDGQGYVELQPGPLPLRIGTPDINDVMYQEPGNYWVIALGPKRYDQYRWAMVTDDLQIQLYILVRDVEEFEVLFEEEVLALAESYGFTTPTNKPMKTNQEGCGYKKVKHDDDEWDNYDDKYYDDYDSKDKH